jgi:hypothetical protein
VVKSRKILKKPKKFNKPKRSKLKKKNDISEDDEEELDYDLVKYTTQRKAERRAIIIVVTLLIIFSIFLSSVIFFTGEKKTSQLSAYNDRWNDISKFRNHLAEKTDRFDQNLYETSSIISSATVLRQIDDPTNYLYVAIGIEKEYSPDQVSAIIDFVIDGGSVIIADDYGFGNSISSLVLDTEVTFNVGFIGKQLWDENYVKNPRFIKINVNRLQSRLDFEGVILMNDPTALEQRSPLDNWYGRTMVTTSSKGWIDYNDDGKHSPTVPGEEMSEKPIMQEVRLGDGRAIFISDPSLFINEMWNRENNSEFADALVQYLVPNVDPDSNVKNNQTKIIIFDESLHIQDSVLSNTRASFFQGIVYLTTDTQLAILVGILMLLLLGVLIIIIENPPELKHKYNIDYYNLNQLLTTDITSDDCDRIRYIFLERLRIVHGLTIEEFKDLSYEELEKMISDTDLVDFALDWKKKYYGQELENILLRIRDMD